MLSPWGLVQRLCLRLPNRPKVTEPAEGSKEGRLELHSCFLGASARQIQGPQILMLQDGLGFLCAGPCLGTGIGRLNWTLEKLYTVHTLWELIEGHYDLGIRDAFLEELLQAGPSSTQWMRNGSGIDSAHGPAGVGSAIGSKPGEDPAPRTPLGGLDRHI